MQIDTTATQPPLGMLSYRLLWKFILAYGLLFAALAAIAISLILNWQRDQLTESATKTLRTLAGVARDAIPAHAEPSELAATATQLAKQFGGRVSVLDEQGKIVADSLESASSLPSQAEQPEVQAAIRQGIGTAIRLSPASSDQTLFYALRVDKADAPVAIVRVGLPWRENEQRLRTLRNRLIAIFAGAGLAILGLTLVLVTPIAQRSRVLSQNAQRMSRGDFTEALAFEGDDEIATLSQTLNALRGEVSAQIDRLQKNSDRLTVVLGTMSEGVVAIDNRKHILFANNAARVLLEFATPDPVGRPLLEAVRNRTVQDAVESVFTTAQPSSSEAELGTNIRRIVAIHARRLPGTPSPGVLVVLHDVTDLRRLENLRQEFVANVSHELKTPLTIIKAFAETLLDGAIADTEHNVSFVRQIAEQAERLHQLILDLLTVARIESGDERFELDVLPLGELIEACVRRYTPAADGKEVRLSINPSVDGLKVMADEEGVREILDNLVDNAIKYTPQGGSVTIRCEPQQSMVRIEIADTGIGIPEDQQNRIFERFYRVDKARSRELGGTGLGLSIVKHLVAGMGGTVSLTSEVNRGTRFTVCLPRA